jgi:AraC-like DNA-binding protein
MNLISLIIGASSIVLFLFSVHLFFVQSGNRYLNNLLGLWMFSRFTDNLLFYLIDSGQIVHFPLLIKLFSPLSIVAPALGFLYIRGFVKDQAGLTKQDWIHLLPFILGLIEALPWYFSPEINWSEVAAEIAKNRVYLYSQTTGFLSIETLFYVKNILVLIYFIFILYVIYKARVFKKLKKAYPENIWLVFLTFVIFVPQLGRFYVVEALGHNLGFSSVSPAFSFVSILSLLSLVFIIGFLVYNPRVLYGFILVPRRIIGTEPADLGSDFSNIPKDAKLVVEDKLFQEYQFLMTSYMKKTKAFLNPGFRIGQMALDIDVPVHHCSYVLNFLIHKNFRDWINEQRISYFIEQYQLRHNNETIESLATASGFNNHATFYNAFKKHTGLTPKAYFKSKGGMD